MRCATRGTGRVAIAFLTVVALGGCLHTGTAMPDSRETGAPATMGTASGPPSAASTSMAATPSSSPAAPCPGPQCKPPPATARALLSAQGPGPHVVDFPFPHLDRCLSADDWRAGIQPGANGTLTVVEGERGWVLRLAGTGDLHRETAVALDAKPKCQTFRYDPWSIEPDPADGTLAVRSDGDAAIDAQFLWTPDDPFCFMQQHFKGPVAAGWTVLNGSAGEACA